MGEVEPQAVMKPIRIIEWDMLNEPRYVGAQLCMVLGMRLTFHPFLVIQNRISLGHQKSAYSGMIDAFRKVVTTEGFGSLYRGLPLAIIRAMPVSTNLIFYEGIRHVMNEMGVASNAVKGLVGGAGSHGVVTVLGRA